MTHRPIIITGPGRSGTSLVAGLLWHLGVFLGHDLQAPDQYNPRGYFEDRALSVPHEDHLQGDIDLATWEARVLPTLKARERLTCPWGWKDPRTIYFIPYYRRRYPEARWVICVREAETVMHSLQRTYKLPYAEAKTLYDHRLARMGRDLHGCVVLLVPFASVLAEPSQTVDRLCACLDLVAPAAARHAALASIEARGPELSPGALPGADTSGGLRRRSAPDWGTALAG